VLYALRLHLQRLALGQQRHLHHGHPLVQIFEHVHVKVQDDMQRLGAPHRRQHQRWRAGGGGGHGGGGGGGHGGGGGGAGGGGDGGHARACCSGEQKLELAERLL
jgi:uncharacterized membrane protein YgcG